MSLLDDVLELQETTRMMHLEDRLKGDLVKGDFEGIVTGQWVRIDDSSGAGIVLHNDTEYVTVMLGGSSLPKGARVELSYADGVYYSDW